MAELDRLEHWLAPLLAQLQPQQVNRLAREVARELRALNSAAIRAQQGPDGQAWEPRKKQLRDARGKIKAQRQQAMFIKLRNASHLKAQAQGASAVVQFVGRTERIARVHHFGLRDRVKPGGPDYDYPARPLLGFAEGFEERLKERILAHLSAR
ncbi:MAG: phage virion morphogenesis protein [Proteobacteria bacterium]|nr:phage virion morphogenesis protein [Pseudomonadota bacterium]